MGDQTPRPPAHLDRHLRSPDALRMLDPEFARAAEELFGHPYRHSVLAPSVRALVVLAVESVLPVADEDRVRAAVDQAVADGASRQEILCTLEISCSIGLHTVSVGLPVLLEEMAAVGLEPPPEDDERRRMLRERLETTGPRPRPLNAVYAAILRIDPDYFVHRLRFIDLPWESAVLDPEAKHLLSIAIDAVSPQHYVDGLRKHIREALAIGVPPASVLEVLQLASVSGLRTFDAALPALLALGPAAPGQPVRRPAPGTSSAR